MALQGSSARRLPILALAFAALVLVTLAACGGPPEPTEHPVPDSRWVTEAIEGGFPSDLLPWLADPRNRGELPSSPDFRARYVSELSKLTPRDRQRLFVLGLGWSPEDHRAFERDYLPWQKQWLRFSAGDANGVVAEATAVRGRAVGADLWIKCYEDIRSTEVTIGFIFVDNSAFAGERFAATAEAARTAVPFIAASLPTAEAARAYDATAEAAEAAATAEAVRPRNATAEPFFRAARAAEDSIDQIFISRRAAGEPGRWMKSGWKHYLSTGGYLVLEQAPAAAFIEQLYEVEEFAVLVTHDSGEDTAAVFDVRYLNAALTSAGWDC